MVIATLLLLAAAADGPEPAMERATARLAVAEPSAAAPRSYRIAADPSARVTSKDRALAATGIQCNLIGDKVCTSRPRTIYRTDFTQ